MISRRPNSRRHRTPPAPQSDHRTCRGRCQYDRRFHPRRGRRAQSRLRRDLRIYGSRRERQQPSVLSCIRSRRNRGNGRLLSRDKEPDPAPIGVGELRLLRTRDWTAAVPPRRAAGAPQPLRRESLVARHIRTRVGLRPRHAGQFARDGAGEAGARSSGFVRGLSEDRARPGDALSAGDAHRGGVALLLVVPSRSVISSRPDEHLVARLGAQGSVVQLLVRV
jgi:hypothetical protein